MEIGYNNSRKLFSPKDYGKWKEYCRTFVLHLNERYGYEVVGTWYIQVFNEPDIVNGYWSGTQEEFFRTYDFAATAVREANGKVKVGPGGFAFADGHLLAAFIDHVTSGNDDPAGDPAACSSSRILAASSVMLHGLLRYATFGPSGKPSPAASSG